MRLNIVKRTVMATALAVATAVAGVAGQAQAFTFGQNDLVLAIYGNNTEALYNVGTYSYSAGSRTERRRQCGYGGIDRGAGGSQPSQVDHLRLGREPAGRPDSRGHSLYSGADHGRNSTSPPVQSFRGLVRWVQRRYH